MYDSLGVDINDRGEVLESKRNGVKSSSNKICVRFTIG